jgi:predicted nucleotidyltransferase
MTMPFSCAPPIGLEALEERLKGIFQCFPEVKAVFLFGSATDGRVRAGSDLDLAIAPASPALRERRLELLAALVQAGLDNAILQNQNGLVNPDNPCSNGCPNPSCKKEARAFNPRPCSR